MDISLYVMVLGIVSSFSIGVSVACLLHMRGFWERLKFHENNIDKKITLTQIQLQNSIESSVEKTEKISEDFKKTTSEASKANVSQAAKINELIQKVAKVEEAQNFIRQTRR